MGLRARIMSGVLSANLVIKNLRPIDSNWANSEARRSPAPSRPRTSVADLAERGMSSADDRRCGVELLLPVDLRYLSNRAIS
jgi:hypothetical protein